MDPSREYRALSRFSLNIMFLDDSMFELERETSKGLATISDPSLSNRTSHRHATNVVKTLPPFPPIRWT